MCFILTVVGRSFGLALRCTILGISKRCVFAKARFPFMWTGFIGIIIMGDLPFPLRFVSLCMKCPCCASTMSGKGGDKTSVTREKIE